MHRHHGLFWSVPASLRALVQSSGRARLGIGARGIVSALVLVVFLAAGCGAGEPTDSEAQAQSTGETGETGETGDQGPADGDEGGDNGDRPEDLGDDGSADQTGAATGSLALHFGDPADHGFAPVTDSNVEPTTIDPTRSPGLSDPELVIPAVADELQTGPSTDEILDAIEPVDASSDVASERDGEWRNSSGELAGLDDEANLACANVEIALGHLDGGRASIAAERVALAAQHAAASGQPTVVDWADPLRTAEVDGGTDDLAVLVGFISACAERGYEL